MKALSDVKMEIKLDRPINLGASSKLKYVNESSIPINTGTMIKTKKANT
jgi:hypothetical protein